MEDEQTLQLVSDDTRPSAYSPGLRDRLETDYLYGLVRAAALQGLVVKVDLLESLDDIAFLDNENDRADALATVLADFEETGQRVSEVGAADDDDDDLVL